MSGSDELNESSASATLDQLSGFRVFLTEFFQIMNSRTAREICIPRLPKASPLKGASGTIVFESNVSMDPAYIRGRSERFHASADKKPPVSKFAMLGRNAYADDRFALLIHVKPDLTDGVVVCIATQK